MQSVTQEPTEHTWACAKISSSPQSLSPSLPYSSSLTHCKIFLITKDDLQARTTVWEMKIIRRDGHPFWPPSALQGSVTRTFKFNQMILSPTPVAPLPRPKTRYILHRLVTDAPRHPAQRNASLFSGMGFVQSFPGLVESNQWKDGKDFFHTSTAHMHALDTN